MFKKLQVLGFYLLHENFDLASKQVRLLFEGGLYLALSVLVCFCVKIINLNHTYKHLASGQRVHNNFMMESIVLYHHVAKVFWMPAIGEELPLAQENVMKHDKYAVAVAKDNSVIARVLWSMSKLSWYLLKCGVSIGLKLLYVDLYSGSAARW